MENKTNAKQWNGVLDKNFDFIAEHAVVFNVVSPNHTWFLPDSILQRMKEEGELRFTDLAYDKALEIREKANLSHYDELLRNSDEQGEMLRDVEKAYGFDVKRSELDKKLEQLEEFPFSYDNIDNLISNFQERTADIYKQYHTRAANRPLYDNPISQCLVGTTIRDFYRRRLNESSLPKDSDISEVEKYLLEYWKPVHEELNEEASDRLTNAVRSDDELARKKVGYIMHSFNTEGLMKRFELAGEVSRKK
jgi:hypothetical protein